MRIAICMICDEGFEYANFGEGQHTMEGDCFGVCPTCRRHAEIGRRVEAMRKIEPAEIDSGEEFEGMTRGRAEGYMDGWNDFFEEAQP